MATKSRNIVLILIASLVVTIPLISFMSFSSQSLGVPTAFNITSVAKWLPFGNLMKPEEDSDLPIFPGITDDEEDWSDEGVVKFTIPESNYEYEPDRGEDVAICAIIGRQAVDIPEWLVHHYHHVGIRRFYIFDDHTEPPLSTHFRPNEWGVPFDTISWIPLLPMDQGRIQLWAYTLCMEWFGHRHKWIAFIDVDEFIELYDKPTPTLGQFLDEFDDACVFAPNWQMHTSNGHIERQSSVRKAYTECIWDDEEHANETTDSAHVKAIVHTKYFKDWATPHSVFCNDGKKTVGENHDELPDAHWLRKPITRNRIGLHHYVTKSRSEYEEKISRGNADKTPKNWPFWDRMHSYPTIECTSMAKLDP